MTHFKQLNMFIETFFLLTPRFDKYQYWVALKCPNKVKHLLKTVIS